MYKGLDLEAAIARNLAFWRGEQTDRPLVGVYLGGYLLQPQQLAPERFFNRFAEQCEADERLDQDLIRPMSPLHSVPWLEAILGCPIRVGAQAIWAKPLLTEDEPLEALEIDWSEPWLEAAVEFVRALVAQFDGRFPVAGPFLRGPADVIAAMIGGERICYEFYEHPKQIHRLARLCAEAWIEVARLIYEYIPSYRGGYVDDGRWLYSPDRCYYSSKDVTSIISPAMYRKFFLPYNQMIARTFPYGFVHRHSVSAHHLTALLDLEAPWAIEVTMDPIGPSVSEMLPIFQQIQEHGRPLIVFGLNEEADVAKLVSSLSPWGLCVFMQADTEEQADALLATAKRKCILNQARRRNHEQ